MRSWTLLLLAAVLLAALLASAEAKKGKARDGGGKDVGGGGGGGGKKKDLGKGGGGGKKNGGGGGGKQKDVGKKKGGDGGKKNGRSKGQQTKRRHNDAEKKRNKERKERAAKKQCRHKGKSHKLGAKWRHGNFQYKCKQVKGRKGKKDYKPVIIACAVGKGKETAFIGRGKSKKIGGKNYRCEKTKGGGARVRGGGGKAKGKKDATEVNQDCRMKHCKRHAPGKGRPLCAASGDPHTVMWDGSKHHYQGTCRQLLVGGKDFQPEFKVIMKTEYRSSTRLNQGHRVSFVKYIELQYKGQIVRIGKNGKLEVAGEAATAPFYFPPMEEDACDKPAGDVLCHIVVTKNGPKGLDINTDFGLTMRFDGNSKMQIYLPKNYPHKDTLGTCGYYDGNKANDMRLPNGDIEKNYNKFGTAWTVEDDDPKCEKMNDDPTIGDCTAEQEADAKKFCDDLTDPAGPFAKALAENADIAKIAGNLYDDCMLDFCNSGKEAVCSNFEALDDAVRQAFEKTDEATGETSTLIVDWRASDTPIAPDCQEKCPAGMKFEVDACPKFPTCNDKDPDCDGEIPIAGCVCEGDTVRQGDKCIPLEQCGCEDPRGSDVPVGGSWKDPETCEKVTCLPGGETESEDIGLEKRDGKCKKRKDFCKADGKKYMDGEFHYFGGKDGCKKRKLCEKGDDGKHEFGDVEVVKFESDGKGGCVEPTTTTTAEPTTTTEEPTTTTEEPTTTSEEATTKTPNCVNPFTGEAMNEGDSFFFNGGLKNPKEGCKKRATCAFNKNGKGKLKLRVEVVKYESDGQGGCQEPATTTEEATTTTAEATTTTEAPTPAPEPTPAPGHPCGKDEDGNNREDGDRWFNKRCSRKFVCRCNKKGKCRVVKKKISNRVPNGKGGCRKPCPYGKARDGNKCVPMECTCP